MLSPTLALPGYKGLVRKTAGLAGLGRRVDDPSLFNSMVQTASQYRNLQRTIVRNKDTLNEMKLDVDLSGLEEIVSKIEQGVPLKFKEADSLIDSMKEATEAFEKAAPSLDIDVSGQIEQYQKLIADQNFSLNDRRKFVGEVQSFIKKNASEMSLGNTPAFQELLKIEKEKLNFTKEEMASTSKMLSELRDDTEKVKLRSTLNELNSSLESVNANSDSLESTLTNVSGKEGSFFSKARLGGAKGLVGAALDMAGLGFLEEFVDLENLNLGRRGRRGSRKGSRAGRLGGRFKGRFGRTLGKLAPLMGMAGAGGLAAAEGAAPKAAAAASAASKASSAASGTMGFLGKGVKFLGRASKFLGPLGLAVTAGMSAYDAYSGWNDAANIHDLGQGRHATLGQKTSAATGSIIEGLTFGLFDKKNTAQFIQGMGESVYDAVAKLNPAEITKKTVDKTVEMVDSAKDVASDLAKKVKESAGSLLDFFVEDVGGGFKKIMGDFGSGVSKKASKAYNYVAKAVKDFDLDGVVHSATKATNSILQSVTGMDLPFIAAKAQEVTKTAKDAADSALIAITGTDIEGMVKKAKESSKKILDSVMNLDLASIATTASEIGSTALDKIQKLNVGELVTSSKEFLKKGIEEIRDFSLGSITETATKAASGAISLVENLKKSVLGLVDGAVESFKRTEIGRKTVAALKVTKETIKDIVKEVKESEVGRMALRAVTQTKRALSESIRSIGESDIVHSVRKAYLGTLNFFTGASKGKESSFIPKRSGLGALSAKWESGKKGAAAVGADVGGASYGSYQIHTASGTMDKFLAFLKRKDPEAWKRLNASRDDMYAPNGKFASEWRSIAGSNKGFGALQHEFIGQTHYKAALDKIKDPALKRMIASSPALQDVLWSTSVNHGASGGARIFNKTYSSGMDRKTMINGVYDERHNWIKNVPDRYKSGLMARYSQERQDALGMVVSQPGTLNPLSVTSPGNKIDAVRPQIASRAKTTDEEKVPTAISSLMGTQQVDTTVAQKSPYIDDMGLAVMNSMILG